MYLSNIYDYLKWRGDLLMTVDPFNDIDALILSELVYVEFLDTVPSFLSNQSRSLQDVAKDFFLKNDESVLMNRFSFIKESINLLKVLSTCQRFKNIKLSNYVNELNFNDAKQFAAITYQLEDDSIFVAYRGTDDTILGWKEDFLMTYKYPVQSQIQAATYLKSIIEHFYQSKISLIISEHKFSNIFKRRLKKPIIRIGGHSKGGNLAVFAASTIDDKDAQKIIQIYNYDGPGFPEEMIQHTNYKMIVDKIKKFIPENSVFGIMLENLETVKIIKSNAKGLMQHNGFTWQIIGKDFDTVDKLSKESMALSDAFKSWLEKVDLKTRESAIKAIFTILESANIKTVDDFTEKSFSHLVTALKEFKNLQNDTRDAIIHFFKTLLVESNNYYRKYYRDNDNS